MDFEAMIKVVGYGIDVAGVTVIVLGVVTSTVWFLLRIRSIGLVESYIHYRQTIGRAILLGLELLGAGDIIRTVAVTPTLQNIAVLGGIVDPDVSKHVASS